MIKMMDEKELRSLKEKAGEAYNKQVEECLKKSSGIILSPGKVKGDSDALFWEEIFYEQFK
jgi:hypothetical protein